MKLNRAKIGLNKTAVKLRGLTTSNGKVIRPYVWKCLEDNGEQFSKLMHVYAFYNNFSACD